MKFLDLKGLQELWSKVLKTRTEVVASNENGALITIAAQESTVENSDGLGKKFTISLGGLNKVASTSELSAGLEKLYGTTVPQTMSTGSTISELKTAVDTLSAGSIVDVVKQAIAEEGFAATYIVTQGVDGENKPIQRGVKINIPKDFLVKSATLEVVSAADTPYAGAKVDDKYIDFVVNTTDASETAQHIYLPVQDLVDAYTAGNGLQMTNNEFSVKLDSTSEEFLTVGANGVKLSGVQSAIDAAKSAIIGASTDAASADTINGAKKYADDAVAAVAGNYATTAQGTKADSALQSVSKGTDGTFVTTTIGGKTNNDQTISVAVTTAAVSTASASADGLATASDVKSYVDSSVSAKNVDAEGDSYVSASAANNKVTVAASASTIASLGKADSAIQSVQVNSADLTPDANKKVNISIAEGATNGTVAVNGTDVAVHGLGSMAYENKNDYATAAQGSAADSALQSISNGTDGDYIDITVTPKGTGATQEISGTVTVQPIASADADHHGLVEASDAKAYVDAKFTNLGEITKTASGTAQNGGVFVVNQVVEENGALKSVGSLEVEQAGAAAAAESRLRGATDAAGYVANDTLAALRNDINSITGGSGSIATQIQAAVNDLDSDVNVAASASEGHVISSNASTATQADATVVNVLKSLTITDGKISAATAETIGAITLTELQSVLVATPASGE